VTAPPPRPPVAPVRWPPPREAALSSCRLLHSAGIVLDLPVVAPRGARLMVSTFWPEPAAAGGWAHRRWQPGPDGRGFVVPPVTELGDLLAITAYRQVPAAAEVGGGVRGFVRRQTVGDPPPQLRTVMLGTWFGYLHGIQADALVLHGPFASPHEVHSTAQQGLLRRLHPQTVEVAGQVPVQPGQPPAAVSLAVHGPTATVGDPTYGWLTVPADQLLAAMAIPAGQLRDLLRPHHPDLPPDAAPVTLAALAARDLPAALPDVLTPTAARGAVDPASDLPDPDLDQEPGAAAGPADEDAVDPAADVPDSHDVDQDTAPAPGPEDEDVDEPDFDGPAGDTDPADPDVTPETPPGPPDTPDPLGL
jgi:hypothetical protein